MTAKIFNEKRYERDNERLAEDSMEKSKRKYDIANVSNVTSLYYCTLCVTAKKE